MQKDQIDILLALAKRGLVYEHGLISSVPDGFDVVAVVDAIAAAEEQPKDAALVIEFLRRLAPDLLTAAVDAVNIPSGPKLATQYKAALDVLAVLGNPIRHLDSNAGRMTVARGDGEIDLPEWTPLEVVDALARIASWIDSTKTWTAPRLAGAVLIRLNERQHLRTLVSAVGDLLSALDPEFDGDVTMTAIEQATRMVERGERPKSTRVKVCSVNNIVHAVTVLGSVAGETLTSDALRVIPLGEEMRLPCGAWIVRTSDGWELWSDARPSAKGRAMAAALASNVAELAEPYGCATDLRRMKAPHDGSDEIAFTLTATQDRQQLAVALDAIDMIAPRPWEAVAEDNDANDEGEWSILDANNNRITGSFGPKDGTTNGEWRSRQ